VKHTISGILARGEIDTWFQSIVDLHSNKIIGYEALARGPVGRYHFPAKLFDGAKRCGLLGEVEKACLNNALEASAHIDPGLKLFINFNPSQVQEVVNIISIKNGSIFNPNRLVFEMTEHTKITDFKKIVSTCRVLKEKGYLIAIDDVGSGYDRLRSIAEVCPDYIKIDRPLVSGAVKNERFKAVIKYVYALARDMGCAIIAEGIENQEELKVLKSIGISVGQGYYFSRPMPVEALFREVAIVR